MKKVKQWMKDHKKEIVVFVVAAGGTALYFLGKEKKIKGVKAGLKLSFEFLDGKEGEDYYARLSDSECYTNLTLREPGYTVGDLGKIGAELMKKIPSLTKDVPINRLNANFNVIKK